MLLLSTILFFFQKKEPDNIYELTTDQLEYETISTTDENKMIITNTTTVNHKSIESQCDQPISTSTSSSISTQNDIIYSEYILSDDNNDDDNNQSTIDNNLAIYSCNNDNENDDHQSILPLNENDKLDDGTISEVVCSKLNFSTWFDYLWNCCECGKKLKTAKELNQHAQKIHGNLSKYLCIDCNESFDDYHKFIKHVRDDHRNYLKFW